MRKQSPNNSNILQKHNSASRIDWTKFTIHFNPHPRIRLLS